MMIAMIGLPVPANIMIKNSRKQCTEHQGSLTKMGRILNLLKKIETHWNNHIPNMPYSIYTKNSYSHNSPKLLLTKAWTESEARQKIITLKSRQTGVIFFYECNKPKESNG